MPLRPPAGFISAFYDPLKVADAPTIGTATGGDASASVTFTAPTNTGGAAITQYYAVSNPSQITGNAASSPVTVSGLTNGTSYTFTVWALNSYGPSPYSAASGSVTPEALQRGLFAGGNWLGEVNVINYININTTGNGADFGDLLNNLYSAAGCGSTTRGIFAGGFQVTASTYFNVIQYTTFASIGNATDFGDLTVGRTELGAANSSTRGVFIGGQTSAGTSNVIDYITIATTGNATDFGDMTGNYGVGTPSCGCSSSTRAVFTSGSDSGLQNTLAYVTIASTGNSVFFGNLAQRMESTSACSSSTRAVFGGSVQGTSNTILYVTIASTGNSIDFGDLYTGMYYLAACSSSTRGVFGAGQGGASGNVLQYITIATTGNSTDFGDLPQEQRNVAACSNVNGGVQ